MSAVKYMTLSEALSMMAVRKIASDLSPRERQVFNAVSAGKTQEDIAIAEGIGFGTVATYCQRIFHKVGVRNLRELRTMTVHLHACQDQPANKFREQLQSES